MKKIRIAFGYLAYPFTMANYFRRALERRDDVELFTFGQFTGQQIPWNGGMSISLKYPNYVDLPLMSGSRVSWNMVRPHLPWEPDLILNIDAGFHLTDIVPGLPYAVVATDPHVLGDWYAEVSSRAKWFFNMQPSYMRSGDILLPYAFDPSCHYPMDIPKEYDCTIVGLHYANRDEWVRRLREKGVRVNYRIGDIYDEYREENNKAWIGLNWSSLNDVTARVFEIMAMGLVPVLNRLDGLDYLGFEENHHYLGFSTMEEAVEKVLWAMANQEKAMKIANSARQFVHERKMTWDSRVETILEKCGLK